MNQDAATACSHLLSRSRRALRGAAVAALVSVLVAGCGSTVQIRSSRTLAQDGLSGGLSTDGATTGAPVTAAGGQGGVGSVPQGGTGGTAAGGGGSTGSLAPGQSSTGAGGATPGKAPIRIGVITQAQLDQAAKAIGLDGVTTGDTKKQVDAVVAWIRANGGLGGHPVQVFEYAVNLSDGSNDAIMANACAAMTQDYKVDVVVTVLSGLDVLAACLQKAGVNLLADNSNFGDASMKKYAPILGDPDEVAPGRMMSLLVDDLVRRGWLTTTSKIGVLAVDSHDGHATVDGPLAAALRRHGLTAAATTYIDPNTGDGGSSASSSAVLRFRAAGVDKVIPVMYSPLYMMIAAESQGYRPAYAMVSAQGPGALLEGTAPANQLKNAAGIGWQPYLDIGKGPKPGPVSARQTLCFELMRKGGQAATSALVKGFQAQVCDMLFYFKDLTDLRPDLPRDLMTSARERLGRSYVSPSIFRVDVSHRTDGMAGYRPLAYLDGCQCFQYVGPLVATS